MLMLKSPSPSRPCATGYPGWENYIAQEAAKRQLRAYIDVRPKGMTTIEEGVIPRVRDSFHYIGRTPAYDDGAFSPYHGGGISVEDQVDQRRLWPYQPSSEDKQMVYRQSLPSGDRAGRPVHSRRG